MNSRIQEIITTLTERNGDIKDVLIATSDGILITNVNPHHKPNRIAAMAAATLGLGKQVAATASTGDLDEIVVSGKNGKVIFYSISSTSVMVVITKEKPNLGLINWESRKTIAQLLELGSETDLS